MNTAKIESEYQPNHDERARQQLVSMLRKHAIIDMSAAMKQDFESRVAPALQRKTGAATAGTETPWRDIQTAMETEASYRFYSAVRYNAQEMCYLSVVPPVERALPRMIEAGREAARSNTAGGSLKLNPQLEVPRYVAALDVHLVPGWVHTEHTDDDVAQGAVVAFGGKVFTGQHPFRKRVGVVGESVSQWVRGRYPGFAPRRILDMGTTNGKNLLPYKATFPDAELHGIDVGAPVLRFANAFAEQEGVPAHYSQQNAEKTDFPDGHFDLIVSSFFLHEVALKATKNILRECRRLLAPGGVMVHMELPNEAAVSNYENFFWNWDTANNNEPYYTNFRAQDPIALCAEAEFSPERSFAHSIPDYASAGPEGFAKFLSGETSGPPHGRGGWFIFGAQR